MKNYRSVNAPRRRETIRAVRLKKLNLISKWKTSLKKNGQSFSLPRSRVPWIPKNVGPRDGALIRLRPRYFEPTEGWKGL
jgi:hypothetical protein